MALATNLDHYWKIDEASGNISDSVGSLTGTNSNVTFGTGIIGNAGVFDAATDRFDFSDTTLLSGTNDFSVSFWIKYTSGLFIITRRTSFPQDWQIVYNATELQFAIAGSNVAFLTKGITLDTNWHHIVITRSGTTSWILYKDGSNVATDTTATSIPTGHTLTFGDDQGHDGLGSIMTLDEVGIWSRAISGAEVTQLYNGGAGFQYPFTAATASAQVSNLLLLGVG